MIELGYPWQTPEVDYLEDKIVEPWVSAKFELLLNAV